MKKALSLMLVLATAFILGLIATPSVEAAECDHTNHTGWTAWDAEADLGDGTLLTGKYYLSADITFDVGDKRLRPQANADVTICLNGHKLTINPTKCNGITPGNLSAFDLVAGTAGNITKLNICDCSSGKTGAIERTTMFAEGRFGALIFTRGAAEVNLYGVTLRVTKTNVHAKASLIYAHATPGVTINIYEGTKFEAANGVTVYGAGGQVNVYGIGSAMSYHNEGGKLAVAGVDKTPAGGRRLVIDAFVTAPVVPDETTVPEETTVPGETTVPNAPAVPEADTDGSTVMVTVALGLVLILGIGGVTYLLHKKKR